MGFIPNYSSEEPFSETGHQTIQVYALWANKRPVGFAPWPKDPKKEKRKRPKRGK